jgi:hypothetical protein
LKKTYDQIKYSLKLPILPPQIADTSHQSYKFFKKEADQRLLEPLLNFDTETDFFLSSLKSLPLKEQLMKIEQYVREHAFYDMKNKETKELKF